MRNLIPEFLADTDASEGSFPDLGCIFLDISGFTAMSSKLSPHEKAGAEVLSQIINTLFTPLVAHVYRDSGVITGFAGDAFSAIFPHHSPDQLLKTARGLQAIVHQLQLQRTRFGDFTLQATIGLGWGPVTWQILEMQDTENILYVHGAGPTSAAHAAYHADPGWIAAQNSLQLSAESRPINADYRRIMVRPLPVSHSTTPNQTPLPAGLQARFRPLSQLPNTDSGEFRTVSCLFASLPNPCSDPSVTDFTAVAAAAAARHGGYFDAVDCSDKGPIALLLFGAPRAFRGDADHAVACAMEIASHGAAVGITRGTVFTGYIGDAHRATYSALGTAINVAARIAMETRPGEVQTTDTAQFSALSDDTRGWQFTPFGTQPLKGISGDLTLGGISPKQTQNQVAPVRPLYGRDAELAELTEALQATISEHSGRFISISGEAGIGKTSLTQHAVQGLSDRIESMHLFADPVLQKSLNPFPLLIHMQMHQTGIEVPGPDSASPEIPIRTLLQERIPEDHPKRDLLLARGVPAVASLLGISLQDKEFSQLDPQARFEWTLHILQELIEGSADRQPCAIIIDDAEELDSDSLSLLTRISHTIHRHPLAIILLQRNDRNQVLPELHSKSPQLSISLDPLPREAIQQIAADIIGGPITAGLTDYIEQTVGRHPLFAAELVEHLQHQRLIYRTNEGYGLHEAGIQAPQSIAALFTEKIDSLSPDTARVAKAAAVIGREFSPDILKGFLPADIVDTAIQDGSREGIWHQLDSNSYRFYHATLQQALVSIQFDGAVRELHGQIADAFAANYHEIPAFFFDRGYHSEQAGRREEAFRLYQDAADYAAGLFKNERAVELLQRCLHLTENMQELLQTYRTLGLICEVTGDWPEALSNLTYALGLTVLTDDPLEQARLLSILGRIQQRKGDNEKAIISLQKSYDIAGELEQIALQGETSVYMGRALWAQGNFDAALDRLHRGQQHSREADDSRHLGLGYYYEGVVLRDQTRYQDALQAYEKSKQELDACGDTRLATYPLYDEGIVHLYQGRLQDSKKSFEHVYRVYQEIGYRSGLAAALLNLGVLEDRQGRFEAAIDIFQQSRQIAEEIGEQLAVAYAVFSIGASYYKMDSFHKGVVYLTESLRMLRKLQAKGYYGYPLSYMASLFARTGKSDKAIRMAALHRKNIEQIGSDVENGRSAMAIGIIMHKGGRMLPSSQKILQEICRKINLPAFSDTREGARLFYEYAIKVSESAHYIDTLIPAHFHLARLLQSVGDQSGFTAHLNTAYTLARESSWYRFVDTLESSYGGNLL